ncbi:MAG: HDOD domain-containing protein [Verrucomicrobiota bacterium]
MKAETLIGKTPNLHPPSPTVVRLLGLLNNPDADYDEVISTVSRDPVLSAKLLALCNSASYGLAQPVASIDQGVLYLGYGEIHRLVMALSFGGPIGSELPGYDMDAGELWRHSLVTALLTPRALALAQAAGVDTSIAYTAGLLHDIGKVVIGQVLSPEACRRIHQMVGTGDTPLLEAEKRVLGCDHAEIGACLLRQWRIPEIIVEAVALHHRPQAEGAGQLAAVVHVADAIAHQTGASPGWESFAVVRHEAALTKLQLTGTQLELLTLAALDCEEKVAQQERLCAAKPLAATGRDVAGCGF